ncbi:MAG: hypothetical protein EZS28_015403 [Streblomastix strix]|uniref:Uncharacterized protein n=1 Tax=Streblomastix strix TaxID=222440 RepID=A0A5J4W2D0_9EUKA|nr:MAG: hypothetical protein EZS28_015403 [Streblomastix strix]
MRDLRVFGLEQICGIANEFSEFIEITIYLRVEEDTKGKSRHRDPKRKKKIVDGNTNDSDEFNFNIPDYKYEYINTNKAIWLRDPKEVNEDEYKDFFKV